MFKPSQHFLRIWLILSLLVLPLDASLSANVTDAMGGDVHTMSVDHVDMNMSASMNGDCPCANDHCGNGDCTGMSHCASGHCSVTALSNALLIQAEPQRSGQIASFPPSFIDLTFPPANRPPIAPLI